MSSDEVSHLSIGEVLSLLQEEFPDVTISKIRFLESQGLIDPERTPSGYRKFYENDVDRLRWILQQQRDHFLPLKVIKDRLLDADRASLVLDAEPRAALPPVAADEPPARDLDEDLDGIESMSTTVESNSAQSPVLESPAVESPAVDDVGAAEAAPIEVRGAAAEPDAEQATSPEPESAAVDELTPEPAPPEPAHVEPAPDPEPVDLSDMTDMSLTADELGRVSGLAPSVIDELQQYGLLITRQVGADRFFDGDAVVVARAAASFAEFGVEPRHLRMYKVASEREAGFFEQVVMPLLKQRNPTARHQAVESVGAMAGLGQQLHAALLRQALDDSLG